jgi:hypothetical protein
MFSCFFIQSDSKVPVQTFAPGDADDTWLYDLDQHLLYLVTVSSFTMRNTIFMFLHIQINFSMALYFMCVIFCNVHYGPCQILGLNNNDKSDIQNTKMKTAILKRCKV